MDNEKNIPELLKTLLTNCLNDKKMLTQVYERNSPYGYKDNFYNSLLLNRTTYCGDEEVLSKHNLKDIANYQHRFYLESFKIVFSDSPSLELKSNFIKTESTEHKNFPMKTFFGKTYESSVEICHTTNTTSYTLSHGVLEASIFLEEAKAFFDLYHENVKNITKELDLAKLEKRIKSYEKTNI